LFSGKNSKEIISNKEKMKEWMMEKDKMRAKKWKMNY
jgi:hypothetical protein